MAKIDSLKTLLVEQLRDIYDAEQRLTKAIPKLVKSSTDENLRAALQTHLAETEQQVARLETAFEELEEDARAETCAAMKGLIAEGEKQAKADYEYDALRDAALIGAAQRVEHYEIAAYGTAIAHASLLELDSLIPLLEASLDEEKGANTKLNDLAHQTVNIAALNERSGRAEAGEPMGKAERPPTNGDRR